MSLSLAPDQSQIQTALRQFLLSILPANVEVIEGQDSRVPEPSGVDFVVMTVLRRDRISTNLDIFADCKFTASISGTTMTVSAVQRGTIIAENQIFGVDVVANSSIQSQISGTPGGIGTYQITPSQTVESETISAGNWNMQQATKVVMQLDVHSANVGDSSDMTETISTVFRDGYAARYFKENGDLLSPLHADDPKQIPFINAEQQWETRWVVTAEFEANQIVTGLPQEFADVLTPGLINVDATYPG